MTGRATALKRARAIREVLLDYGVPEVSIELVPGRPTSGDRWNALDPVAAMSHHIASRPTPANPTPGLRLVKSGRADLPGPLCNGTAGVDLVYRIVTLGLANHSGYGGPLAVTGPLGSFRIPENVGRPYAWGTEYEGGYSEAVWDRVYVNRRTGKRMTFREFMGRANAGLVEAIWLPGINSRGLHDRITPGMDLAGYHVEHKTWAPGRKPDRLGYTTDTGRDEVRRYARTAPAKETADMAWTDKIRNFKGQGGEERTAAAWLMRIFNQNRRSHDWDRETVARVRRMEAKQDALAEQVAILVDRSLTEEEREARLDDVADRLAHQLTNIEIVVSAEARAGDDEEA